MRISSKRSHFWCQKSYDSDGINNNSNSMENSSILKGFEFIDFNYVVFFFYEYYFFKKLINAFVSSFY